MNTLKIIFCEIDLIRVFLVSHQGGKSFSLFAILGKTLLTIIQWQSQPILSGKLLTTYHYMYIYKVDHVGCLGGQVKHLTMYQPDTDK